MSEMAAREHPAVGAAVDTVGLIGLGILCALTFLWDVVLVRLMVTLNMNDFGKFYYSARAFLAGQDMYAPSPATQLGAGLLPGAQQLLNLNPPHFHLLVIPLAGFQPSLAILLWMLASTMALVLSVLIAAAELEVVATSKRVLITVLFVLTFSASQAQFITGQLTFLLLLPVILCWRSARRGHWDRAGAWLGACLSIKLFFLIFIPYLIGRRRWRAAAVMIGTSVACFAIGLLFFGSESYASWIGALRQSGDWAWLGMNASTLGFFQRVFGTTPSFAPMINAPAVVRAWVVVAGMISLTTLAVVITDVTARSIDRAFALLLTAAQLVSPVGWVYYLWLAAVPVAAIAWPFDRARLLPRSAFARCLLAIPFAGFVMPITSPYYFEPSRLATLTLGSEFFWATLALWVCVMIGFARDRDGGRQGLSLLAERGSKTVQV